MALQQPETHKGIPLPEGYWAISEISVQPPLLRAVVRLGLYYDASKWSPGNKDNELAVYPTPFIITGDTWLALFNPENTQQQTLYGIFQFIKAYKEPEEETGYFENAEIVP